MSCKQIYIYREIYCQMKGMSDVQFSDFCVNINSYWSKIYLLHQILNLRMAVDLKTHLKYLMISGYFLTTL